MNNQEVLEKAGAHTTAGLLNGGYLNPSQQTMFITLVKRFSVLLSLVRFIKMPRTMMDVDKFWVGEPVTESADEATDTGNLSRGKTQRVTLQARKLKSAWNISTETLQGNIEQNEFEATVMNTMVDRISTDMEDLAINGDTGAVGTDIRARLLRRLDGWDKQTNYSSHILDAKGATIQKGFWASALRRMPKQYKNDSGLRWLVGDALAVDWADVVSDRGTILGDAALQGAEMSPMGRTMVRVPLIYDSQQITTYSATRAEVLGANFGPFEFTPNNDRIIFTVDGGAPVTVTFTHGTLHTAQVCAEINAAAAAVNAAWANVAIDDREGRVWLRSPTVGGGSALSLEPVTVTRQAYTTLGLVDGVPPAPPAVWPLAAIPFVGQNAGTPNSSYEGSFMWLVNPMNFIFGILDGTRIFTEFNKNTDMLETVVFNQVDAKLENGDAIVKVSNIRRRTLVL